MTKGRNCATSPLAHTARASAIGQYEYNYLSGASFKDKDGHRYPYYTYTKCRTQDALGNTRVVAIPLPFTGHPRPEFTGIHMFHHRMNAWPMIPYDAEDFVAT
jgi:hypothetical protein